MSVKRTYMIRRKMALRILNHLLSDITNRDLGDMLDIMNDNKINFVVAQDDATMSPLLPTLNTLKEFKQLT